MIKIYIIPILSIQDTLVNLTNNSKYIELERFIDENEPDDEDYVYINIELEKQWYPEVVTTDKWLAWKLIQKYGKE